MKLWNFLRASLGEIADSPGKPASLGMVSQNCTVSLRGHLSLLVAIARCRSLENKTNCLLLADLTGPLMGTGCDGGDVIVGEFCHLYPGHPRIKGAGRVPVLL